jgi:hypothetical protein
MTNFDLKKFPKNKFFSYFVIINLGLDQYWIRKRNRLVPGQGASKYLDPDPVNECGSVRSRIH